MITGEIVNIIDMFIEMLRAEYGSEEKYDILSNMIYSTDFEEVTRMTEKDQREYLRENYL